MNQKIALLKPLNAYSTYSDEQLLLCLRDNDHRALKALHDRYWEKLFIAANSRLQGLPAAEEAVQDVLINLWNKRESLELKFSLNTYLATAIKYEVINRLVKKSREIKMQSAEIPPEVADNSLEEKLAFDHLQERLSTLVQSLPERCRLVFTLSREQGFSQKQIARHMDISENTVERQMKIALRSLRTGLQNFFTFFF